MGLLDMLQQYANVGPGQSNPDAADHFDKVAQTAPPGVVAQGISAAMRSDQTPPFGQMVGQLFEQASPQQRAAMLNQLLATLGPGALAGLAGGALGNVVPTSGTATQVSPEQASQLSPQQIQQVAEHAEQHSPSVIDKMSDFYAQHPGLIKTLGGAALTIALAKISNNMRG